MIAGLREADFSHCFAAMISMMISAFCNTMQMNLQGSRPWTEAMVLSEGSFLNTLLSKVADLLLIPGGSRTVGPVLSTGQNARERRFDREPLSCSVCMKDESKIANSYDVGQGPRCSGFRWSRQLAARLCSSSSQRGVRGKCACDLPRICSKRQEKDALFTVKMPAKKRLSISKFPLPRSHFLAALLSLCERNKNHKCLLIRDVQILARAFWRLCRSQLRMRWNHEPNRASQHHLNTPSLSPASTTAPHQDRLTTSFRIASAHGRAGCTYTRAYLQAPTSRFITALSSKHGHTHLLLRRGAFALG